MDHTSVLCQIFGYTELLPWQLLEASPALPQPPRLVTITVRDVPAAMEHSLIFRNWNCCDCSVRRSRLETECEAGALVYRVQCCGRQRVTQYQGKGRGVMVWRLRTDISVWMVPGVLILPVQACRIRWLETGGKSSRDFSFLKNCAPKN